MPTRPTSRRVAATAALAFTALAAPAVADDDHGASAGGAAAPDTPRVTSAACGASTVCGRATTLTITGEGLDGVRRVTFLGRKGRADDRAARPADASAHRVDVQVPRSARTGPIRIDTSQDRVMASRVRVVATRTPTATTEGFTFPIAGKAEIGTSAVQRFGGARNHQGQDIFSPCGTPVVAPIAGTVSTAKYQSAAGNYVVVDGVDGRSYALMHLQQPSTLRVSDTVAAGDPVGATGTTGRATGCQLHFELWTAPGWYTGGVAIDPYRELRAWQRAPAI